MEIKVLIEKSLNGEITAFIGDFTINNTKDFELKIIDYLLQLNNKEKVLKALHVVELSQDILEKKYKELSTSELNKVSIVEALLSKEENLIFNNINKCLTYREIENIKRVLKKLVEHGKKVIVISNDVEFLFNLTKRVYAIKDNVIVKEFYPVNWFDNEVYNFVSKSPIIEFVMNLRKKNIKIEDCIETKELLKAIYRSVGK